MNNFRLKSKFMFGFYGIRCYHWTQPLAFCDRVCVTRLVRVCKFNQLLQWSICNVNSNETHWQWKYFNREVVFSLLLLLCLGISRKIDLEREESVSHTKYPGIAPVVGLFLVGVVQWMLKSLNGNSHQCISHIKNSTRKCSFAWFTIKQNGSSTWMSLISWTCRSIKSTYDSQTVKFDNLIRDQVDRKESILFYRSKLKIKNVKNKSISAFCKYKPTKICSMAS